MSLLDEMLAEVEGALSSPDRRELVATHAPALLRAEDAILRAAACSEDAGPTSCTQGDSPLPPPPSHFAAQQGPAAHGGGGVASGGGHIDDLASKLAARRAWEQESTGHSQDASSIEKENISNGNSEDSSMGAPAVSKEEVPLFSMTDLFNTLAPETRISAAPGPEENGQERTCKAQDVHTADKDSASWTVSMCLDAGKVDEACQDLKENHTMQDKCDMPSTLSVSVDADASIELSPEEFKEKVDRKIAYFETLARVSRVKALEDAVAEQSLQEARSRIEASATKRRESHRQSLSAPVLTDDLAQAQCILAFWPGSLSLNDLSNDCGISGDREEQYVRDLPESGDSTHKPSCVLALSPVEPAPPPADTGTGRKNLAGNCPKSVYGISPVVEMTTPDKSGDVSPCADEESQLSQEHKQQQLFWHAQVPLVEIESEIGSQVHPLQNAPWSAPGSPAVSKIAEDEGKKTWAGALACATPTHLASDRKDEHDVTEAGNQDKVRDKQNTTRFLGKLDTFWGSLRSPFGATPMTNPESSQVEISVKSDLSGNANSLKEKSEMIMPKSEGEATSVSEPVRSDVILEKATVQGAECAQVSEEDRKGRAAEKRAAFLANVDRLTEDQPSVNPDNDGHDAAGADTPATDEDKLLLSLETRAQRLSDIASSCDVSLSNSSKASFESSPHHSDVQGQSNDSMNKVSPVLPESFEGTLAVQNTTVDKYSANASFGCHQERSISTDSCQVADSDTEKSKLSAPVSSFTRSSDPAQPAENRSLLETAHTSTTSAPNVSQPKEEASAARGQTICPAEKSAGIGVQVKRVRGLITIVDLLPDGPAAQYLKKGQVVLQIDGSGLATLAFKSVLAKFRGPPGSVALLTVVDSAAALKAGQEPQAVGVQRFRSSANTRRSALPAKEPDDECVAPAAESTPPAAQKHKVCAFAPVPRVEQDPEDSGLCSPYSDPGDAISDRAKSGTSGAISIDSLQNLLLERLFGGNIPISSDQTANESSISGVAPCVTLMTPAHELVGVEDEKFRFLTNTSHGSEIHSFPTRVTGALTRSMHDTTQNTVATSSSSEFGKRLRSPNANAMLQNRSDKRMRYDQGTAGTSLYCTAPSLSNATTDTFSKPSRSTGPRKPAVPKFAGTTGRSSSAPKSRPVLQERGLALEQQQKNGRIAIPAKKSKVRVSVTIHAQSAKSLAPCNSTAASTRNPMRVFASSSQHKIASPPQSRQVRPKTAEKRKTPSSKSSARIRRSEAGGMHAASAKKQDLDNSIQVYADVGRAVTSLMHKLSKTPDPNRRPDKEEIIQTLGKLTGTFSSAYCDDQVLPSVATSRQSDVYATRKSVAGAALAQVPDKENISNVQMKSAASAANCGWGDKQEGSAKKGVRHKYGTQDAGLTFDAVLKRRFGL